MADVAVQEVRQGLPTALEPFFIGTEQKPGLLPQAEQVYGRTYEQTYQPLIDSGLMGAGRVAPITGTMLETAQQGLGALGPAAGFDQGAQAYGMAGQIFENLAGVQAPTITASPLTQYQMAGPQNISADQVGVNNILAAQSLYRPQLQQYSMGAPQQVGSQAVTSRDIQAAQTAFDPQLMQYQLNAPQTFSADVAQQYMSPYQQLVIDAQQRAAIDAAKKSQLGQNLAAARQGTYGGARQALLQAERESGLRSQLGDIQAKGLADAYSQAQAQFERDRAAQLQAGQTNIQSALQTQQLGTQTGLQTALANLNNEQQARVQSEANRLQAAGMTQDAALRAAISNQQAGLTVGQQNLAAQLGVQELGAQQSLQVAMQNLSNEQQARIQTEANRLQAAGMNQQAALQAATANQAAQMQAERENLQAAMATQKLQAEQELAAQKANQDAALAAAERRQAAATGLAGLGTSFGNLGVQEQEAELQRLQAQAEFGALQQGLGQQVLTAQYEDALREAGYPESQITGLSGILRGTPTATSQSVQQTPEPSLFSQIAGAGLTGLSLYNMLYGGKG